ncbi:MAG TPA: Fe-S protein assembly co-chaperone HscB [Chitinophagaceae bacterium]|nr:Fe-S protein assembly co-chaperone HscB [Chitinophagaceae bacterium]
MNYFELFEIPVSPIVDQNKLSSQYFALQKKYHPDFFTNATEEEQNEVLEKSSIINKGFKTLKDPDNTIKYVLEIKGLLQEEEKYELPPDFLMEMMELNEGLMDEDILNVEETETKIFQLQKSLYAEVQNIIEDYSEDTTTGAQLLLVKDYYYKKKYLKRILDRLDGIRNIASQN